MTAITSRRWIKLPPTWPMKPRSQSTIRMTIIVQSMGNPLGGVEPSSLVLSRGCLLAKPFPNIESNSCYPTRIHEVTDPLRQIKIVDGINDKERDFMFIRCAAV